MIIDIICIISSYLAVLTKNKKIITFVENIVIDRYLELGREDSPKCSEAEEVFSNKDAILSVLNTE